MDVDTYVKEVMDKLQSHDRYESFVHLVSQRSTIESFSIVIYTMATTGYALRLKTDFIVEGIIKSAFDAEMGMVDDSITH